MRKNLITLFVQCAAIMSFVLAGCNSGKTTDGASSQSVTGVAATGAPIVGAVSLQDSSSPAQVRTTTSADNGAFTVDVSGLVPPYLLNVDWTDNTGRHKMYAFAEQAGTTNINPFSNVAFAAAVGIPDQVALAASFDPTMYHSIASRHEAVCDNLRTALGPLFELFQTAKDPVTDAFNADHTGLDALFDNVKIFVNNGMIVVTNKDPYRLIFKGPIDNITAGTFYPQNMPNVAATSGGAIDGAALYRQYCAGCHNPLASSKKAGATASQIQAGISNVGQMSSLSTLTQAQIDAIAAALATTATTPPPASTDGAALYTRYCSGCHDALGASTKAGATALRIQAGIRNVSQMSSLSTLTQTQIDAIAAALATTSTTPPPPPVCGSCHTIPPATGQHAFHVNSQGLSCGTCHGTGYSKTTVNSATHQNGTVNIASTPGWNPTTRSCSNSCHGTHSWGGTTQTTPPAGGGAGGGAIDGAALYGTYCSGCHNALASSSKSGRTATQISAAIASVSNMNSLSTLTSAQIDAIATALATTSTSPPPPTSTDGAALYGTYCSGCHNALASSSKSGRTATQISAAIASVSNMNSLSTLTSAQIDAIATALATTSTTPPPSLVCGSCHAIPPATGRHDLHVNSEGLSCGTCHGAGYSKTTVNSATHMNGVTNIASGSTPGWNPTTRSCSNSCHGTHSWGGTTSTSTTPPPAACGSCHTIPPATGRHDLHVNSEGLSCGTCHGTGYSKTTVNSATHQNGVVNIASGSTPGWNPTTRSCSNSCHGTHSWGGSTSTPATTPTTGTIDGAALYGTYCSGCHGPLATSGHRGATVAQIQTGINTISGMMSLSSLTTAQLQAISDALNSTTSTPPSTTPPPLVCGSCHAIPPSTGHHSTHQSRSCATCHGTGYSSTTVNTATHQNGAVNIASGSTPGWNPTTRSCSNSCHGTERW